MTTTKTLPIGEVSSGTMRDEDLIPCFFSLLSTVDSAKADQLWQADKKLLARMEHDVLRADDAESLSELTNELFDVLDNYCPPFCYFGAHEGDGACYGVWVSMDSVEESVLDGETIKIAADDEWPADAADEYEYILEVTDHGNCTLYSAKDHSELWAIV